MADDPNQPDPPTHADPVDVAKKLLLNYLRPSLERLSADAQRQLVDAWRSNPAALVAAGSLLGAAGATYLIASKSALPGMPAIPLDSLGGMFKGAELQFKLTGPVTHPDGASFTVTFHERPAATRAGTGDLGPARIDAALAATGSSPERIAEQINGPEFETETAGGGPEDNWSLDLGERVRLIGEAILAQTDRGIDRPFVYLGDMAFVPNTFARGLTKMVKALARSLPDDLRHVKQVNFAIGNAAAGWVPVLV